MDINRLSNMVPINKTAALVTNQSGCAESEELTLIQERECFKSRLWQIDAELASLPKPHEYRKELGLEKQDIQNELNIISSKVKHINIIGQGLNEYILRLCKKKLGHFHWGLVLKEADKLKKEADSESHKKQLLIK